jgi:uncharacterized repeat protein (TIGR04052 family)
VIAAAVAQSYHVRFAAAMGSQPFRCGESFSGIGRGGATVTPEYFRFYVSGIRFIDTDGRRVPLHLQGDGTWQQRDVALLGFEDPRSDCANGSPIEREEVVGDAPAGNYQGIEFALGIPEDLNHADPTVAEPPLSLTEMFWTWQAGYKFLRFDARVTAADGTSAGYVLHLGSTGCTLPGNTVTCTHPNLETIVLMGFDPAKNVIVADLASLFEHADLAALAREGGCLSVPTQGCEPVMHDLGIALGTEPAGAQSLFRVR